MSDLTHIDQHGHAHMVDVSAKESSLRSAYASARIITRPDVIARIQQAEIKKGDVLATARIAGIMAAKRTSELIPLCHPLPIEDCNVSLKPREVATDGSVEIEVHCRVAVTAKTGAEMEALTGATVAALTLYDMGKAVTKDIVIRETRLITKTGGKSDYQSDA